jgi:hypothetical protein
MLYTIPLVAQLMVRNRGMNCVKNRLFTAFSTPFLRPNPPPVNWKVAKKKHFKPFFINI